MVKVQKNSNRITPLAGISFIDNEFTRSGLGKLIDSELGKRVSRCGYQYSDIFRAWFNIFFCGAYCAEDIAQHLRPTLENIPENKVPSPAGDDTLLTVVGALRATPLPSDRRQQHPVRDTMSVEIMSVFFRKIPCILPLHFS
ncbi:MAG: hypothetical protein LBR08_05495 [Bacteroidales bacterium]|jgi:hypothetical protein|nr:hypothetical protein [Bacteroidales bacterium]